jgi:hypothetical protein
VAPAPYYAPGYWVTPYPYYGRVRIEGQPKNLRDVSYVYVNGELVGVVDDFDGVSQRLHLPPGEYDPLCQYDLRQVPGRN